MRKSFTLTEIVVVITIIGLMAAAIVSLIQQTRARGRDVKRVGDVNLIAQKLNDYFMDNKEYPGDLERLKDYLGQTTLPTDPKDGEDYDYECIDPISAGPINRVALANRGLIDKINEGVKTVSQFLTPQTEVSKAQTGDSNIETTIDAQPLSECQAVDVDLTVTGTNALTDHMPIDMYLVMDHSASMTGAPLNALKQANISMLNQLYEPLDQVGLVFYSTETDYWYGLGFPYSTLISVINNTTAFGDTNMARALKLVDMNVPNQMIRPEATKAVVLLSDGLANMNIMFQKCPPYINCSSQALQYATNIKNKGVKIYTIGLNLAQSGNEVAARNLLKSIASDSNNYYSEAQTGSLNGIFNTIANKLTDVAARNVIVNYTPPSGASVTGTIDPAPTSTANGTYSWNIGDIKTDETRHFKFKIALDSGAAGQRVAGGNSGVQYSDPLNGSNTLTELFPATTVNVNPCQQPAPGGGCRQYRLMARLEAGGQANFSKIDNDGQCKKKYFMIENSVTGAIISTESECTP